MKTILFVCSGNTCRSPMAAALMNALQDPQYHAESAGLSAFSGDGLSAGALNALRFIGTPEDPHTPYTQHRSRQTDTEMMASASLIVGITKHHADSLRSRFPSYSKKIIAFPRDIPDPYGQDLGVYLSTLTAIRCGIAELHQSLYPFGTGIYLPTESDIPAICEIETASFSTPWSADSFHLSMNNPATHIIIQKNNGTLVGYAVYSVLFEEAELYNIAVAPAYRNEGFGASLLQAVIQDVFTRGAEILHLEVRRSNISAQNLYEKYGFRYDSEIRKNYYQKPTEDALLMHLTSNEIQKEPS